MSGTAALTYDQYFNASDLRVNGAVQSEGLVNFFPVSQVLSAANPIVVLQADPLSQRRQEFAQAQRATLGTAPKFAKNQMRMARHGLGHAARLYSMQQGRTQNVYASLKIAPAPSLTVTRHMPMSAMPLPKPSAPSHKTALALAAFELFFPVVGSLAAALLPAPRPSYRKPMALTA